jgi:hypothetical protein
VTTGLFGMKTTLVPINGSTPYEGDDHGTTCAGARADEGFPIGWDSTWLPRRERLRHDEDHRARSR